MSNSQLQWRAKLTRRSARAPRLRLDHARVERDKQGYSITITGFGLQPGPVPPHIVAGGRRVTEVRFSADQRKLTGRLEGAPKSTDVAVNLGPGLQDKCQLESV